MISVISTFDYLSTFWWRIEKKNVDEQVSLRLSKPSTPVQTSAKSLSEEYLWMTLSCYEKNYDLKNTGKYVRYRRPVRHTVIIVIISKLR